MDPVRIAKMTNVQLSAAVREDEERLLLIARDLRTKALGAEQLRQLAAEIEGSVNTLRLVRRAWGH